MGANDVQKWLTMAYVAEEEAKICVCACDYVALFVNETPAAIPKITIVMFDREPSIFDDTVYGTLSKQYH